LTDRHTDKQTDRYRKTDTDKQTEDRSVYGWTDLFKYRLVI